MAEARILQFGTIIDVSLIHHDLAKAEQTLSEIEKQLTGYRANWHAWEDSDLSRFNRSLVSLKATDIPPSLNQLINLQADRGLWIPRLVGTGPGGNFCHSAGHAGHAGPANRRPEGYQQQ